MRWFKAMVYDAKGYHIHYQAVFYEYLETLAKPAFAGGGRGSWFN